MNIVQDKECDAVPGTLYFHFYFKDCTNVVKEIDKAEAYCAFIDLKFEPN